MKFPPWRCCPSCVSSVQAHPSRLSSSAPLSGSWQSSLLSAHQPLAQQAASPTTAQPARCRLPSALQPQMVAAHRPSLLDFHEELMHELLQQLPAQDRPRKHGGHPPSAHATAAIHCSELAPMERDCKQCSHRPRNRKQTNYICDACKVHLCLGECFRVYHANM